MLSQLLQPMGHLTQQDPALLARIVDFDTVQAWSWSSSCVRANVVVGTDQYIAPESYSGEYSKASDMFAIGTLLYRLLTHRFPFDFGIFEDEDNLRQRMLRTSINWTHPAFSDKKALHLCRRLLSFMPRERPTANQALADPWLAQHASEADSWGSLVPSKLQEMMFLPPGCIADPDGVDDQGIGN